MKYFFLKPPHTSYSLSFSHFAHKHNYKVTVVSCVFIAVVTSILMISKAFVDYSVITYNYQYARVLGALLFISIFYAAISLATRNSQNRRSKYMLRYFVGITYPIFIIGSMMCLSFIAQKNPANTMSMFLIGMFYVGGLWILSFKEALSISLITLVCLGIGLYYFQSDYEKLILNYIVGGYIMLVFYVVSRIIYSYHFNYFNQLKTIEANNKEINKINKLQNEMLSIAVHDLRGPINNIITLTDLVKNYAETESDRNEYYEMILSACYESNHIIQDLITVAKEKNQKFNLEEVNINTFLQQLVNSWHHTMPEKRELALHVPSQQLYSLVDTQKMQRVINNLISNAIKFTEEGGAITLILTDYDNRLRISVKDNGIGIPESSLPYLFDRFSKAGRTGLKGEKSHGLGLSICRQIVEQHGGAIGVDSTENVGTIFNIDLGITKTADAPANTEKRPAVAAEVL